MSAAHESKPPPSSRGARGARGGGRRANFGGSLTSSDSNRVASSSSRARSNNPSRAPRPSKHHAESNDASTAVGTLATVPVEAAQPQCNAQDDHNSGDNDNDELPPEAELCFICADPIKLVSVARCDHRTCHICALRLRILYKKDECTFCKSKIDRLIFTSSLTKSFSDFEPADIPYTDKKLPISFETKEALEESVLLLRYNCPDPNCEVACTGWKDYKAHIRRDHHRLVCQLCISNKKIFAHEHTLHTEQSLVAHEKAEHRLCEYDRQLFYSDDELFTHMRDRHEQCHICKASGSDEERWKYYRDYDMLEKHFRRDHWLCENSQCLQDKFQVFANEMDFKAHQLEKHGNELSTRERREALRIDAGFTYDDGATDAGLSFGGRGGKKGKARAQPSTAPATASAAEASGSNNRDVLRVSTLASRPHVPGAGPANHEFRRAMFGSGLTNAPTPQLVSTDPARTVAETRSVEQRHQAYMDQVTAMLGTSESRITSFRHAVRVFNKGESSARDLISTLHSLVGDLDRCAPLVKGLMELVDDADKTNALREAWDQYRNERTQFPSLTPAGSSVAIAAGTRSAGAGAGAGAGQRRGTLRSMKNSSAASSSLVWDNVERAASASSGHGSGGPVALRQHFPALTSSGPKPTASIPGSLAHAVAHAMPARANSSHPRSTSSAASNSASTTPKPFVERVHSTHSSGSVARGSGGFPSLPSNADRARLNAHKRALFASKSSTAPVSASLSGTSTPSASAWSAQAAERMDDFPEMATNRAGALDLDGLADALGASLRDSSTKARRNKGVQMMTLGGVHRG